jgi:predicted molibdopterin-dependent oxidoreductase YjgC
MSAVNFTVNGASFTAQEGQSIAAALMSNGIVAWRETRFRKAPRGVFCGIGQCFDCLVTINGVRDIRACLEVISEGDDILLEVNNDR